jgi:hypothetical protein
LADWLVGWLTAWFVGWLVPGVKSVTLLQHGLAEFIEVSFFMNVK